MKRPDGARMWEPSCEMVNRRRNEVWMIEPVPSMEPDHLGQWVEEDLYVKLEEYADWLEGEVERMRESERLYEELLESGRVQ